MGSGCSDTSAILFGRGVDEVTCRSEVVGRVRVILLEAEAMNLLVYKALPVTKGQAIARIYYFQTVHFTSTTYISALKQNPKIQILIKRCVTGHLSGSVG